MAAPAPALIVVALLPLIGWRLYVRVKRLTTRQRISKLRHWITLVVFPILLGLVSLAAFAPPHPQPERLAWLALGLLGGAALSVYGLKHTTFEPTPQGIFFTPNARLGVALSLLFVGRVVYRLIQLAVAGPVSPEHANDFTLSPFTLVPIGLLAGYSMAYAAGLIRYRRRVLRARDARLAAQARQPADEPSTGP